jgi:hypothetical protein
MEQHVCFFQFDVLIFVYRRFLLPTSQLPHQHLTFATSSPQSTTTPHHNPLNASPSSSRPPNPHDIETRPRALFQREDSSPKGKGPKSPAPKGPKYNISPDVTSTSPAPRRTGPHFRPGVVPARVLSAVMPVVGRGGKILLLTRVLLLTCPGRSLRRTRVALRYCRWGCDLG